MVRTLRREALKHLGADDLKRFGDKDKKPTMYLYAPEVLLDYADYGGLWMEDI